MVLALEVVLAVTRAGFCRVDSMGFFLPRFNASGRWAANRGSQTPNCFAYSAYPTISSILVNRHPWCVSLYRSAMDRPFFRDRRDAGRLLAGTLLAYRSDPNVVVFGLPRGGIPVAFEIAMVLQAPLDVCVVRKLGVPDRQGLAMG